MENETAMTLSPAAQAVLNAFLAQWDVYAVDDARWAIAAALRAAADQIAPVEYELIDDCWYEEKDPVRDQLLAIADELEGAN